MDTTEIKVTKLGKRWHARLFLNNKPYDEMACSDRRDIGMICREMLRWVDKTGWFSKHADRARHRQYEKNNQTSSINKPHGRIWHHCFDRKLDKS